MMVYFEFIKLYFSDIMMDGTVGKPTSFPGFSP